MKKRRRGKSRGPVPLIKTAISHSPGRVEEGNGSDFFVGEPS
jgi:hypothetical protein